MPAKPSQIVLKINPHPDNSTMRRLMALAWADLVPSEHDYQAVFSNSCVHIGAYLADELIGYVNVAWDGGVHGFLLDTTVHPDHRRTGLGVRLVRTAYHEALNKGVQWMHVDYLPEHETFYASCGFRDTRAGIIKLGDAPDTKSDA